MVHWVGTHLKRWLPWVGSTALMAYLFYAYDAAAAWQAFTSASLGWLAGVWLVAIVITWLIDTKGLQELFGRLNDVALPLPKLLAVKGASYFLNIVNYAAAAGGIGYMVWKRTGRPAAELASSLLFLNVLDLMVLNAFVTAGLLMGPMPLSGTAQDGLLMVNIGLWAAYFGSCVYWNGGFDFFVLGKLRSWPIFAAFSRARLPTHGILFAWRFGMLCVYIAMQYAALHLFNIPVPLGEVMVYNSLVTLVQVVPISIAGLGTTQVVQLAVYSAYGTDAQILAYGTASVFAFMLVRAAIGYPCLKRLTAEAPNEKGPR